MTYEEMRNLGKIPPDKRPSAQVRRAIAHDVLDKRDSIEDDVDARRLQVAAMLIATDQFTYEEIGEVLELCPKHLRAVICSPLFQGLIRGYRRVIPSPEQIADRILADSVRNIRFIRRVRSGREKGDAKMLSVRLKASEMLFDRQAPKRMAVETEETKRTVIIETHQMDRMKSLMGPIDSGAESEALGKTGSVPLPHEDDATSTPE